MGMAVACLLASCKKENNNESKDATYFKASIEQGNGDSKTYLDPDGNVGYVKWSVGDQFKLAESTGSATATFTLVEGEEGKAQSADFICHGFDLEPSYTAAYPAGNVTGISNGTVTFDLPATQSITATGTFGNGAGPMVAAGDGPELSFKNVCGGLGFPLKGAGVHVTGLRLTSNKTTDKLWGTFTVANCSDAEPTLTYGEGGSNVIQLVCDVDLTDEAQWFYVMLPPGTLTDGFTLEVLNGENVIFTRSTANNPNMVRNVIRGINSDINLYTTPEGAISGKFTINSSGDKVYFSQGNLQWSGVNGWRFAEHQYDFVGGNDYDDNPMGTVYENGVKCMNEMISFTYTGWIDLFSWGCSGWSGSGALVYKPDEVVPSTWYSWQNFQIGGDACHEPVGDYAEADWAYHNPIVGGGNQSHMWRTMTEDERMRQEVSLKTAQIALFEQSLDSENKFDLNRADSLLDMKMNLGNTYSVSIDLDKALNNPGSSFDIILRANDQLDIPQYSDFVKVSGEVMYPISIPYKKGASLSYYIRRAGGYTSKAGKKQTYTIYMNGSVAQLGRRDRGSNISPGSEIVVPTKPKRDGLSTAEIMILGTSTVSISSMIISLINNLK